MYTRIVFVNIHIRSFRLSLLTYYKVALWTGVALVNIIIINNTITVSRRGTALHYMGGGDFDGDELFFTDDEFVVR